MISCPKLNHKKGINPAQKIMKVKYKIKKKGIRLNYPTNVFYYLLLLEIVEYYSNLSKPRVYSSKSRKDSQKNSSKEKIKKL